MLLLNILVEYEDDVEKALWVVELGIVHAAERVNIHNSQYSTKIQIVGATQIPETNLWTKGNRAILEQAGIHTTLDDFIYED